MPDLAGADLASPRLDRFHPNPGPAPEVESADALGSVDLVPADGHQVDLHVVHVQGNLADRLQKQGDRMFRCQMSDEKFHFSTKDSVSSERVLCQLYDW